MEMSDNTGKKDASKKNANQSIYQDLKAWIEGSGGTVHPSLELRNDDIRGLFASKSIKQSEVLLRVPSELGISGEKLPRKFKDRLASPWLRCLASLILIQDDTKWKPYVDSLPSVYETLWQWNDDELEYLGGTTLGDTVRVDRHDKVPEIRYKEYVKPYLDKFKIAESWQTFQRASMCISTRGFHIQSTDTSQEEAGETLDKSVGEKPAVESVGAYMGPFLLPMIDLINHSNEKKATTLQRDPETGAFYMLAEKDIEENEELFHSYGEKLTAAQILQTFGFVPQSAVQGATGQDFLATTNSIKTPAVISKEALLAGCKSVKKSSFPKELEQIMQENEIDGDIWELEDGEGRDFSFIPDQILVEASAADSCLSDEIVTICCIYFLSHSVYKEVFEEARLLDCSALEDYFLGKLVIMAILTAVKNKLAEYKPIQKIPGIEIGDASDDGVVLRQILKVPKPSTSMLRAMYGITVRLEEKQALKELRNELISLLASLDEDVDEDEDSEEQKGSLMLPSRPGKKQKMTNTE